MTMRGFSSKGRGSWAPLLAVVAVALLTRLLLVGLYASPVPYFDQWDAEGAHLLKPWTEGTLRVSDLFIAHNEHRVAVTRLLTLVLFQANSGEWDNLVEAGANAVLFAGLWGLLFAGLLREGIDARGRAALLGVFLVLAMLPYAWENALVGFQSQFYAMFLCVVGMVMVACRARIGWGAVLALAMIGMVSLFTMAAGLLAPLATSVALLMRRRDDGLPRGPLVAGIALMAACAVLGFWLVPQVPWHDGLKAQGPGDFMHAMVAMLFWPFAPREHEHFEIRVICALLLWWPWVAFATAWLRGRRATPGERVAFVIAGWALVQAAVTAYARGHGTTWVWSRYMDIPALACACNAFLAVRWAASGKGSWQGSIACPAWLVMLVVVLISRTGYDLAMLREAEHGLRAQQANTLDYLSSRDATALAKPVPEIPYPEAGRLRDYLDDPMIQSMLPAAIRPPALPPARGNLSRVAARWQATVRQVAERLD